MRKLLIGIVIVLLLIIVAIAGFLFVPSPLQKWAVERGATMAIGRQVTFGDPFRLRAWPPLEIAAADIRVANADWGKAPEFAVIESLDASIDLLAFWRANRVELGRLIVTRPQLNLEIAEDGRQNWAFGENTAKSPDPRTPAGGKPIPGFVLGDIRIEGGVVSLDDRASKQSRRAEAIDLAIHQSGADQPIKIDGGLTMAGQRATLAGSVARPQGVAAGETSPLVLALDLPGGALNYDGTINTAAPAAKGRAEIKLTGPRELLAWLGQDLKLPDNALRTASLQTQLDLGASRVALEDLKFQVDEITGSGRAAATLGQPPAVEGEIALGALDLDPYLPADSESTSNTAPAPATPAGWSDEPITLPLPLPIDVDFRLRAASVRARQIELGALNARLQSDRQQAAVTLDELQAYGGRLAGSAKATPGSPPAYAVDLQAQDVHLLAALQALLGKGRFDGQAELRLALATAGGSQRQLVQALGGDGKIVLRDGAVLGINIAGMLRQIMTLGLDPGANQQQRTDFAEAGGSFKIQNGILRNEDLILRAPVLRLDGAGSIDLPQRTVDYRITPQLATTLEGQGASGKPALQAGIPFLVQGPFAAPSVRFDLNGTLTGAISSPDDLARVATDLAKNPQAVQLLRDKFDLLDQIPSAGKAGDLIEGVLGGAASPQGRRQEQECAQPRRRRSWVAQGVRPLGRKERPPGPDSGQRPSCGPVRWGSGRHRHRGRPDRRDRSRAGGFGADTPALDAGGRLVAAGFVDSHVHLDKSCIGDRCRCERGDLAEAIAETARAKAGFTAEDVHERASRTLERCILHGTTRMRTHVEVDPGIGLRGLEGVLPLVADYRWAIDLELCVFPQEGLLNNPGTEELMVAALRGGATVVGGAPYTDSDPHGQIDRLFALAREFDADLDLHLDFSLDRHQPRPAPCLRPDPALRPRRPRRDRPCDQALDAAAGPAGRRRPAPRRRRRGTHRAAGDRPLSDGPRPYPRGAARRDPGA